MNAFVKASIGIAAIVGSLGIAVPAHAASTSTWDKVAQCESGGNWHDTAGTFEGGLQFSPSTWEAYGGTRYAPTADHASKSKQIAIAEKVLNSQGPGAWPTCGPIAGLTSGGYKAPVRPSKSRTVHHSTPAPVQAPKAVTAAPAVHVPVDPAPPISDPNAPIGYCYEGLYIWYVVQPGDTLYNIARTHGTTYQIILSLDVNSWITNPALIHPGDEIYVPIGCLKY